VTDSPASSRADRRPLLAIEDLRVSFARRAAPPASVLHGVSLSVFPSQTLAIVGESGSGKSVTAMSVLRLLPPTASFDSGRALFHRDVLRNVPDARRDDHRRSPVGGGEPRVAEAVDLLGLPMAELRAIRGRDIAMIFQEPMTSLNPVMTVGEQVGESLALHRGLSGSALASRTVDALREVGIEDAQRRIRAYPHEFSGGMRQRVMIASALACDPALLIADEPTTALDVTTQARILALIDEQRARRGLAVILITHDLSLVRRQADVVCVMYDGRVVEYGPTSEVLADPRHPYTRALLACRADPRRRRERLPVIDDVLGAASSRDGVEWWPTHPPPVGLHVIEPSGESAHALFEISPTRWVRCWRVPSSTAGLAESLPSVPMSRAIEREPVA
jgi:ABC-type dipeptide/oligopeptide/nickel transport system ATPase component